MLPIGGQTAGPIGLKFFMDTHGWAGSVVGIKNCLTNFFIHGECRALQLVSYNVNKIAGKSRNCYCKNKTFDKET